MLEPDFSRYSLALIQNGRIVHSSVESGLRPLVECILQCRGKFDRCELHDRVTGLAAARLAAYSGIIVSVTTGVVSVPAREHLNKRGIALKAGRTVENIRRKDGAGICPMEQRALDAEDDETFFLSVKKIFGG